MNHPKRGQAIIINNETFDPRLKLSPRKGTAIDANKLKLVLSKMGFEVSIENDCLEQKMRHIISTVAKQLHEDEDCFVLIILTHGEAGKVFAIDKGVDVDDLLAPLKKCPSLAGKPKIIIIQACRGKKLDEGIDVMDCGGGGKDDDEKDPKRCRVPVEADFLMAFSSASGYSAWRNQKNGSWFVQALVDVLDKNWDHMDLLTMMTRVCNQVALNFESDTNNPALQNKKQVPNISSTLTKDVFF